MKCPHCNVKINESWVELPLSGYGQSPNRTYYSVYYMKCPNNECSKLIVQLGESSKVVENNSNKLIDPEKKIVFPPQGYREVSLEVEDLYALDFKEASAILSISPKASAMLSRRCLQNILRNKAGIKRGNLKSEIEEFKEKTEVPSYIRDSIDIIRCVGNAGAHPNYDDGGIVEVNEGDADYLLELLEDLFDFYFVKPARAKKIKNKFGIK